MYLERKNRLTSTYDFMNNAYEELQEKCIFINDGTRTERELSPRNVDINKRQENG
jgi:hypothetical protein